MITAVKSLDFTVKNPRIRAVKLILCLMLFVQTITGSGITRAIEVEGLYQGSVNVLSRNNEQERNRAFSDAFRQVLIKVTGNTDVLSQAPVRRALSNAEAYVDTWSYRAAFSVEGVTDTRVVLNVSFFEPEVLSLLDTAGIPIWPQNRPYTLVWMVIQDELGERQLLGSTAGNFPAIQGLLETEASNRALPLLLPVLDIEDRRAVTADDIWNMDVGKLLSASDRYQSESILAIRVFRTLGGEVLGKSSYLFRNQVLEVEMYEEPVEEFITASVALATNELSSYYAVLLSGTDSNIEVRLTVEGVKNAEDYAGLLEYVSGLTDVNAYQVSSVSNETIQLTLYTGGQLRQLVETIALNRSLLPNSELLREENQVFMSFLWNK